MLNYELVEPDEARNTFQDENGGLLYGINWLDDDEGEVETYISDCQWFATAEERQEALDRAYAEDNQYESEQ